MNSLFRKAAVVAVAMLVAGPALAKSDSYCAYKARQAANNQAAGKTVIGAGVGCLLGQIIAHRCGVGMAAGGVTGFAVGSSKWRQAYDRAYWRCKRS
jgi:hypothetical protein